MLCVHMVLELLKLERDVTFFSKCVLDDIYQPSKTKKVECTFSLNYLAERLGVDML